MRLPEWRRSQALPTKSWVFAQLIDGQPKAYPLPVVADKLVVNDTLSGQSLVIIHEDGGHGAMAYERGDHIFFPASLETTAFVLDEQGLAGNRSRPWSVQMASNCLAGRAHGFLVRLAQLLPADRDLWPSVSFVQPEAELVLSAYT